MGLLKSLENALFNAADKLESNPVVNRRALLQGAAATAGAVTLISKLRESTAAEPKWDVSYMWHTDIDSVLDYQEVIGQKLGPEVEKELHVVRGRSGNYGLIYDRNGTKEEAEKTAKNHQRILKRIGLEEATPIQDEGYSKLYNVVYGKGPNLQQLKGDYKIVYRTLGIGVGKDLVIERINGDYALVWRRRGDLDSTFDIARGHAQILKKENIEASVITENNNPTVFGESSHLDEDIPVKKLRAKRQKPKLNNLELEIETLIGDLRKKGLIEEDEVTAWSVYDFTTGEKLVSINEDVPLQCASMVKPLVALAFFDQVKKGNLSYTSKARMHMERMIQKSSNSSTNWVIDRLGGPGQVQKTLKDCYGNVCQQTNVVERIPGGGRTYRNKASTHDYSRFLYNLWNNNLPYSQEIKRLMALPGRDRVYTGAKKVPEGTLVYNKTGSTARLCGDMGILYAKGRDGERHAYTVVGVIQKQRKTRRYLPWIASRGNVIREVSNKVYEHLRQVHDLV
ncbi:serine hydrolase [Candidatus Woesearchaeota archaeon]|nr:serine hydrolase [Candidatus Woesearchaeota archaeon]